MIKEQIKDMKLSVKICLIISCVFTVLGLACSILSIKPNGGAYMYRQIAMAIVYILVVVYSFIEYKKPHGNLLKWLFIAYAVSSLFVYNNIIIAGINGSANDQVVGILHIISICLSVFCAGRLNKFKQNVVLMIIVGVILAYEFISTFIALKDVLTSFLDSFTFISPFAMWIVLCTAYFARYEAHKQAGLVE